MESEMEQRIIQYENHIRTQTHHMENQEEKIRMLEKMVDDLKKDNIELIRMASSRRWN